MSSRVRQGEPPGRSRPRRIANFNETPTPARRLNFRLPFLSFVYFVKRPIFFGGGTDGAAPRTPGAASGLERILSICSWRSSAKCCPIGSSITSTPSASPARPSPRQRAADNFGAQQNILWCAPEQQMVRTKTFDGAQGGDLGWMVLDRIYWESDSGKVLWA